MPRKIAVVVTARPSYARIKTALKAIEDHPELELQLIVAASALLDRYGKVADVMEADGFKPVAQVHMVLEGESPLTSAKTLGIGVSELASVFDHLKPDCVVTVADRYETLATAIAASYMNIPLAHVQGGEITGNIDEKVRHSVTKLADLHLVANDQAAQRVRKMGETWESIAVTGCPSIDLAKWVWWEQERPSLRNELFDQCQKGMGAAIDPFKGDYIIVQQHPMTYEWEQAGEHMAETLQAVDGSLMSAFWFWPNVDSGADLASKAIRTYREKHPLKGIRFLRNMPPECFLLLLANAKAIVGNSSVAIREASYLGTPAVDIGNRQSGRDHAENVIWAPHKAELILSSLRSQLKCGRYPSSTLYGEGQAGARIAHTLSVHPLTTEKRLAL